MRSLASASVDFGLTDPPYLCNYHARDGRTVRNDDHGGQWLYPAFQQIHRLLKPDAFCVSFYGWHKADQFIAIVSGKFSKSAEADGHGMRVISQSPDPLARMRTMIKR